MKDERVFGEYSPALGESRIVTSAEQAQIVKAVADTPVVIFQELNKLMNARGPCLSISSMDESAPKKSRAIQKFRADDGTEFNTEAECDSHEALCADVATILATLNPRPNNSGFNNGGGYVQQSAESFGAAHAALLIVANRCINGHPRPEVVSKAWLRIMCTDKNFREWGQPYFANH